MIQSMQHETLVETLLNTLEAERYVRGPLLLTIVDALSAREGLEVATEAARSIEVELESLADADFVARIVALRQLVQALSAPESGHVLSQAARDALARAPRQAAAAPATSTATAA